jgi:hypothetical protein
MTPNGGAHVTSTRRTPVALITPTAAGLALTAPAPEAAGSRAGATRAAKRHTIAYVKRYDVVLRTGDLDLLCSAAGRSRWKCSVYANGGQCTGTLTEVYSTRVRTYRPRKHRDRLRRVSAPARIGEPLACEE